VILDTEDAICRAFLPLHRAVEQIPVRHGQTRTGKAVLVYGVAMVLRGHLDFASLEVHYRVVSAAVAEFQLIGLRAVGQGDQLVPKAND